MKELIWESFQRVKPHYIHRRVSINSVVMTLEGREALLMEEFLCSNTAFTFKSPTKHTFILACIALM